MATDKKIDRILICVTVFTVIIAVLFMNGDALGIIRSSRVVGYESRLFDTSRLHTIDIVMDDWDGFIEGCEDEEYVECTVAVDGEKYANIGIRAKGNTSLSNVSSLNSTRYSFKIEFDHYVDGKTYYGLDKLCLNNMIQDNTLMKDYLTYRMMAEFGVDAPLVSYVWITVNGEDFGLYLAVEGIEDSFLDRVYGSGSGDLYKPDSMSMGGGRGNGRDFDMNDVMDKFGFGGTTETTDATETTETGTTGSGTTDATGTTGTGATATDGSDAAQGTESSLFPGMPGGMSFPGMTDGSIPEMPDGMSLPDGFDVSDVADAFSSFTGMGSSAAKLVYSSDDVSDYSEIFDSAKTDVTEADKTRLIASLKKLNACEDLDEVVDTDKVMRYFVVHNAVVNGDSYTGSMIHNYYLYEEDGVLSMIPWDYNLAFGGFQSSDAEAAVNDPIDTPLSTGSGDARPMFDWITSSEETTARYHELVAEFVATVDPQAIIDEAYQVIGSRVADDPTSFVTVEEFETGVETLKEFCALRWQSLEGQANGMIPTTDEGQQADDSALIPADGLTLSDMGSMMGSMGGGMSFPGGDSSSQGFDPTQMGGENMTPPDGFDPTSTMPSGGMQGQQGFDPTATMPSGGMAMPEGTDPTATAGAEDAASESGSDATAAQDDAGSTAETPQMPEGEFDPTRMGGGNMTPPDGFDPTSTMPSGGMQGQQGFDPTATMPSGGMAMPEGTDPTATAGAEDAASESRSDATAAPETTENASPDATPDTTRDTSAFDPSSISMPGGMMMPDGAYGEGQATIGTTTWLWTGGACVLLALGILFAALYKRR